MIITTATKNYFSAVFTILAETGAEGKESEKTSLRCIDKAQGIINIVGTKGHDSGSYKLRDRTAEMLKEYLAKNPAEYPFPTSKQMQEAWRKTRARAACKHQRPELYLAKFLEWYLFNFLYRDPIDTRHLRHKKLETTKHYIRGTPRATEGKFIKIANTAEEACELLVQELKEAAIFGEHIYTKPE